VLELKEVDGTGAVDLGFERGVVTFNVSPIVHAGEAIMKSKLKKALGYCVLGSVAVLLTLGSQVGYSADTAAQKEKAPSKKKAFHWPHGAKVAVSLTHDDGCPTHLANAIPTLDKYGLKGTFFLIGSDIQENKTVDKWIAVSKEGHELGSHTMFHPCPKAAEDQGKGKNLEDYTLDRLSKEMDDSIALLKKMTGKKGPFPFSYPCGDNNAVGEKGNQESYIPLVAKKFLAGTNMYDGGVVDPGQVSFTEIPTKPEGANFRSTPDGMISFAEIPQMGKESESSGDDLIKAVQQAEEQGGWASFCFHGVGGDWIPTKLEAYQKLCEYLSKNQNHIWVAPFGDVVRYIKSQQKGKHNKSKN